MENEYGVNTVSLEMDRDASAESQSETTLFNSPESGLTAESSRGDADAKKMGERAGWTNERHNSYLAYLENSFVKQLYSLLGGEETLRLSSARDVQSNSHKSTDQFTLVQNGFRQKVNFEKKRAHLETSPSEFHSLRQSPEYPNGNYTMGVAVQVKEEIENAGDKAFSRISMRTSLGHEYHPAQSSAEASGQNFREEVGEKGCNSGVSRKRRREANYDDSSLNDQVVP